MDISRKSAFSTRQKLCFEERHVISCTLTANLGVHACSAPFHRGGDGGFRSELPRDGLPEGQWHTHTAPALGMSNASQGQGG